MERRGSEGGSAQHWGPLFGESASEWAETWEGPHGWGTPAYEHVLDEARIKEGTRVLDCGCGAGRFARMAADRGAVVSGLDAAAGMIEIASSRTPEGDFRVGDLESLPWPDDSHDVVTGFSSFQFAEDKEQALREARRVSNGQVVVVIPSRVPESGVTQVFQPMFPLFDPDDAAKMKESGMFALSEPGKLEDTLAEAGLDIGHDEEIACPIVFEDTDEALRAFVGAGPTALAIRQSGKEAVTEAAKEGLEPFIGSDGRVSLPGWYRAVIAS